ncbi:MAG: hypothetical protein ABSF28_13905 [Terracidiphilus sp.]|jgi:hypothetical protein
MYGTALSAAQLDATSSVAGGFAYTPAVGATLTADTHPLSVTFTPTDTTDYATARATVQLMVNQAVQTINFTVPTSPVSYGVAPIVLAATECNDQTRLPVYAEGWGCQRGLGDNRPFLVGPSVLPSEHDYHIAWGLK